MLVIVSDLHFKDGTTGTSISANAFRLFANRLQEMAGRASRRADGSYHPIEQIDLVLLGDILDPLRSTRWFDTQPDSPAYLRPWHDPQREDYSTKLRQITQAIIENNREAFAILRSLSQGNQLQIAENNSEAPTSVSLPVNIYYMVGNHDWYYHLPGPEYDAIRQTVIEAMGLANPPTPFPHSANELSALEETLKQHSVFCRHGDIYDRMNYNPETGRNTATLGDAIALELVDRFHYLIQHEYQDTLPQAFVHGLRQLGNVRPTVLTPLWIEHLIRICADEPHYRETIEQAWDKLVDDFLALDFIRQHDSWNPFDRIDAMEAVLRLTKPLSFHTVNRLLVRFRRQIWGGRDAFSQHALGEDAYRRKDAQYIVYGHTHIPEVIPLDVLRVGNRSYEQVYINTGTWNAYHELAAGSLQYFKFVQIHLMTFAVFYREDERSGRKMEVWNGTLSPKPEETDEQG